ncbi:hypothetical protein HELRODRAFT_69899 [Helobdella robusta]|uniref:Protein transport protein Sec24B n=1 Tax=Helobdella robusta TaxID=6412 RepID=T1FZZ4_HELRO|nr:hypothetical protein HELRODRAFT_69899 [Helobdella robusta]ESN92676.1 hypothetical protein HELRODRAFT_69899 [Helobdella robusta]
MKVPEVAVYNLLQERNILPKDGFEVATPSMHDVRKTNCHPDLMSCTANVMPNSNSLLQKTRLPLGLLVHPFKDLSNLQVIQSCSIVRCRSCRTYINPFVVFVDPSRWKCNICFKANELPSDFCYDSTTNTYIEPHKRPEVKVATVEYVASTDYMLRPPQPAVYLYLLDVSFNAVETGYLSEFCEILIKELDRIPGDSRKQIGFIAYDTSVYFFNLSDEHNQPQILCMPDLEDADIPCPDGLLVNLEESRDIVLDLLEKLPAMFSNNTEVGSCLGTALEVAYKMMTSTGGRVTVLQTHLPTVGAGALKNREDANERVSKNIQGMGPVTDFYKKLALECSAQQICIDIFFLNSQFTDIATISCASKFTSGTTYYFPGFHRATNLAELRRFRSALTRYLTRKIGFEAVMRVRCTRGLNIHTFHGNGFVRSTDLLSLPNVNPDASFGLQMSIDDTLESNYVFFQAALLYTSSKGERRIRVHTLCIPVSSVLSEVQASANQRTIISLISKMAVDKSLSVGLGDSREALVYAALDIMQAYRASVPQGQRLANQLLAPQSLKHIPLLVLALLKFMAFRIGISTKIDDRVYAMELCKWLPLKQLLLHIYPALYPLHNLTEEQVCVCEDHVIRPSMTSLSSHQIDRHGAYVMDAGSYLYLYLGSAISDAFCAHLLDVRSFAGTAEGYLELPELDNNLSLFVRKFVEKLNHKRTVEAPLMLIREDGKLRHMFYQHLVEDRTESSFSYLEFLQHLQKEIKV